MHHLLSLEECERQKCQTFLYFLQKGLIYHSGWEKKKKVSIEKKTGTSEGCDAYILYYSAKYNSTNNK